MLSIVTPAYNEAANLPLLHERLCRAMDELRMTWEWIVVDDNSSDGTFGAMSEIAARDSRVRGLRFSRHFGSQSGFLCGFHQARGDAAVGMAGDGQDPPELIPRLGEEWRTGVQVVWATRFNRASDSVSGRVLSRLYDVLMRKVVGITDMPAAGADFFLIDRKVIGVLEQCGVNNMSIIVLTPQVQSQPGDGAVVDRDARHGPQLRDVRSPLREG